MPTGLSCVEHACACRLFLWVTCCVLCVFSGEIYDLLDMYEAEEAQKQLYNMKPHQLYMHLALQGE